MKLKVDEMVVLPPSDTPGDKPDRRWHGKMSRPTASFWQAKISFQPRMDTDEHGCKYAEGVTAISPVLADAIGLRRENVPQNFPSPVRWERVAPSDG